MTKDKIRMEYEEAPSGSVALYNYKEPFMPVENGHGYLGVLMQDAADDLIQCHVCGEWFKTLAKHIREHNFINVKEYKTEFGLSQKTSLVSDSVREKLIESHQGQIPPSTGRFKKGHPSGHKLSIETRNLRGTCPLQLLDKLDSIRKQIGHIPTFSEVKGIRVLNGNYFSGAGLVRSIAHVYGNWNNAAEQLGWVGVKRKTNKSWDKESLMMAIRQFYETHGRFASESDMRRKVFPHHGTFSTHFGSYKKAKQEFLDNKYETKN